MPLNPTSGPSGGGTFNGGTITDALLVTTSDDPALRVRVPESVNDALRVEDSDDGNQPNFLVDSFGYIIAAGANLTASADYTLLGLDAHSLTTRDAVNLIVIGGGTPFRLNTLGYLIIATHSAPADATLEAGECALWFDQTDGAAKFMVKAKQADGSVKTAAVALT